MAARGWFACATLVIALAGVRPVLSDTSCDAFGPRTDCGYPGIQQGECEQKGCCWMPVSTVSGLPPVDLPWCFVSNGGWSAYTLTEAGNDPQLRLNASTAPELGPDVKDLSLSVQDLAEDILRVKLADKEGRRWQIPTNLLPDESLIGQDGGASEEDKRQYDLHLQSDPFSFTVVKPGSSTNVTIFNTTGLRLVYKDQYLELSSWLPASSHIYGFGERTSSRGLALRRDGRPLTLWNRDCGAMNSDENLYGSHPFYMEVQEDGNAHGVLLWSSNGMDIVLRDDRITYRVIGGVLDLLFFTGPTPADVLRQYTAAVGRPAMPPLWSLGFHNCRWGYTDVGQLEEVLEGYESAGIPLETVWSDIDYMDGFRVFTLDPHAYALPAMRAFIDKLHAGKRRWVPIVDPGVKIDPGYPVYDEGLRRDVFIKSASGKPYVGQVWPGATHFPDFMSEKGQSYWVEQVKAFHEMVPFDGLWIDMNEVSSFCNGDCSPYMPPDVGVRINATAMALGLNTKDNPGFCHLSCDGNLLNSTLEAPPYAISNGNARLALNTRTAPVTATHLNGDLQYNTHNLFGLSEAQATSAALTALGKRPFILTRSTFPGSGAYAAHWTGDNAATWNDLRWSITSTLSSGLAGVPFAGADICGFSADSNEELCTRWIEAGAFYPFSRDHNVIGAIPQELFRWPASAEAGRRALGLRYKIIPYLYTAFRTATATGCPVARPIFFQYPGEAAAHAASDAQWLLGDGILVSPVLHEGADSVDAYFPPGRWYSLWNDSKPVDGPDTRTLPAPLEHVNVHVAGGTVVPMRGSAAGRVAANQAPVLTLAQLGELPLSLLVALPKGDGKELAGKEHKCSGVAGEDMLSGLAGAGALVATGSMYLDAGEELEVGADLGHHMSFAAYLAPENETYAGELIATFPAPAGRAQSGVEACKGVAWPVLDEVTVLGVEAGDRAAAGAAFLEVLESGVPDARGLAVRQLKASQVEYDAAAGRLTVRGLDHQLRCPHALRLRWGVHTTASWLRGWSVMQGARKMGVAT